MPLPPEHEAYLWGSPAMGCALLLGRAFNASEPPIWHGFRFVHLVSLLLLLFCGIGAVLVLLGQVLELRARDQASDAIKRLLGLDRKSVV